ncbi:MAG: DNA polymerase III subunit delta' [Coriobacteriia bacterium]|nr:DNA polymerase III subunit delta' [Coriobacteriia bacterium]
MPSDKSLLARSLTSQDSVRAFLGSAIDQKRISHAYLFVGPPGSGKLDAAYALAQAIVCPEGGCGACDDCVRVARRVHPDVHLLQPQSAQGYLIAQIRALIDDLSLAPIRSSNKVYIMDEAETLTPATANALLKSLEEPPAHITFILLGTTHDAILPTVLSRCQVVPFRSIPVDAAAQALSDELGTPVGLCRRALGCCSSPTQARGFLGSQARQDARRSALHALEVLPRADALDVLDAAKQAVLAAKAPLADLKDAQQAVLDENASWMTSGAMKELEERQKRELSARERSGIMELFAAQRCLLRDALVCASGREEAPFCDDFARVSSALAARLGVDGCTRALMRVDEAMRQVRANVSPQLALEAMLFDIKEMLTCHS